jgi:hypothetical protein
MPLKHGDGKLTLCMLQLQIEKLYGKKIVAKAKTCTQYGARRKCVGC